MDSTDEILVEFILEAREILDQLDINFVALEKDPTNGKLIANIFRAIHTLKGSSGFFSFKRLEKISHAGESLLGKIRDGQLTLNAIKTTKLLEALDVLRLLIGGIEKNQTEPTGQDEQLISDLLALASGNELSPPPSPQTADSNQVIALNAELEPAISQDTDDVNQTVITNNRPQEPAANISSAQSVKQPQLSTEPQQPHEISFPVKVNIEALDKLMNLVSEMVLARNRLLPFTNQYNDLSFSNAVRNIDLLTLELQERMMKMRMQPISQVWSKFPRLIRDVSNACGKQVNLIQEGAETELDRSLLDAIRDPIVHLIRNSIDHSIETPAIRTTQGKNPVATLNLRAGHENGMVVIEIADDGAGINYDLIRQRIVDKNFIDPVSASQLSDSALIDFIFLPGFSTKAVITNLSGRGVGMDVVKNNITNIGGSIEISSPRGLGTTIQLKIPLTLAIIPALIVGCDGERYIIPQSSILELVSLDPSSKENGIEDFYGVAVFRLREKIVPIIFLSTILEPDQKKLNVAEKLNIIVLESKGINYGLVVNSIFNIQDVVVKPLGSLLKNIPNYAGATILGDGRVSLILDIDGIAASNELARDIHDKAVRHAPDVLLKNTDEVSILLFELAGANRMAIPLELVERIIFIDESQIQKNGNREVVQFTNEIMHLIRIGDYIDGAQPTKGGMGSIPVIIHQTGNGLIGLAVELIHDIISVPKNLHISSPPQKGIVGCVLTDNQIINMIDLEEILVLRNMGDRPKSYSEVVDVNVWR